MNLKACSRCGGDLISEELLGETEFVCLQCGHRTFAPAEAAPRHKIVARKRATARKAA